MANNSRGRCRHPQTQPAQPTAAPAAFTEPEMRRWPHPVDGAAPANADRSVPLHTDAALHYIRCALSYQNQLLADIKALLERLAADAAASSEEHSST